MKRSSIPPTVLSLIVAVVYFAAAELGLSLASLHSNVTAVWPPTGIVRHLVELHGGTVSASNRKTGGAVLTVQLPAFAGATITELIPRRSPSTDYADSV
jgi:hypothetical protein